MNLNQITVTSRVNLGDYSHREVSCVYTVDEHSQEHVALDNAIRSVEWHAHKPERLLEYNKNKALLTSAQATDEMKAKAQAYIDRFDAAKKEVEG